MLGSIGFLLATFRKFGAVCEFVGASSTRYQSRSREIYEKETIWEHE